MKNWMVPVSIEGDYWSVGFYMAGFDTALEAKTAAQANVAGLATYAKTARAFVVGTPQEV